MKVKYNGPSDFQEFNADDMNKAGLKDHGFKKTSFPQGQAVEVPDVVGEALVSKEGLFGDYNFEEVSDDGEDDGTERAASGQPEVQSDQAGAQGEGSVDSDLGDATGDASGDTAAAGSRGRATRGARSTRESAT